MSKRFAWLAVLIVALVAAWSFGVSAAPQYLWSMDSEDEIADYGNDNTGADFELNKVFVAQGAGSCKVTPGGDAAETKMALKLEGTSLPLFIGNDSLVMNVYIPAAMAVKPNTFFMGMADVTGDWKWVDGIFSLTVASAGWNKVVYPLGPAMMEASENNRYMLYFAFFAKNADGSKPPLKEAFYLDAIWMERTAK